MLQAALQGVLRPADLLYLPASHRVQLLSWLAPVAVPNRPCGHGCGAGEPAGQKEPGPQTVVQGVVDPSAALHCPSSHSVQALSAPIPANAP